MICSYLLHGHDVIRLLKLCIEERSVSEYNTHKTSMKLNVDITVIICTLIHHGFLPVISVVKTLMLYSNIWVLEPLFVLNIQIFDINV